MIEPRPYQQECIEAIELAEKTGTNRQLVALPISDRSETYWNGEDGNLLYGCEESEWADFDLGRSFTSFRTTS